MRILSNDWWELCFFVFAFRWLMSCRSCKTCQHIRICSNQGSVVCESFVLLTIFGAAILSWQDWVRSFCDSSISRFCIAHAQCQMWDWLFGGVIFFFRSSSSKCRTMILALCWRLLCLRIEIALVLHRKDRVRKFIKRKKEGSHEFCRSWSAFAWIEATRFNAPKEICWIRSSFAAHKSIVRSIEHQCPQHKVICFQNVSWSEHPKAIADPRLWACFALVPSRQKDSDLVMSCTEWGEEMRFFAFERTKTGRNANCHFKLSQRSWSLCWAFTECTARNVWLSSSNKSKSLKNNNKFYIHQDSSSSPSVPRAGVLDPFSQKKKKKKHQSDAKKRERETNFLTAFLSDVLSCHATTNVAQSSNQTLKNVRSLRQCCFSFAFLEKNFSGKKKQSETKENLASCCCTQLLRSGSQFSSWQKNKNEKTPHLRNNLTKSGWSRIFFHHGLVERGKRRTLQIQWDLRQVYLWWFHLLEQLLAEEEEEDPSEFEIETNKTKQKQRLHTDDWNGGGGGGGALIWGGGGGGGGPPTFSNMREKRKQKKKTPYFLVEVEVVHLLQKKLRLNKEITSLIPADTEGGGGGTFAGTAELFWAVGFAFEFGTGSADTATSGKICATADGAILELVSPKFASWEENWSKTHTSCLLKIHTIATLTKPGSMLGTFDSGIARGAGT